MLLLILTLILDRPRTRRPRIGMERSLVGASARPATAHCGLAIRIPAIPMLVLTPMLIVSHLLVAVPVRLLPLLVVGMEQEDQQQRPSFSDRLPFGAFPVVSSLRAMAALPAE